MTEFFKTLWLVQTCIFLPVAGYLVTRLIKNKTRPLWYKAHVICLSCAFSILMFVDVYTIWIEDYPPSSGKGFAMLTAFIFADLGVLGLLVHKFILNDSDHVTP